MSYLQYEDKVFELLKSLSKTTSEYLKQHRPNLKTFLVTWEPFELKYANLTQNSYPHQWHFEFPTPELFDRWMKRRERPRISKIMHDSRDLRQISFGLNNGNTGPNTYIFANKLRKNAICLKKNVKAFNIDRHKPITTVRVNPRISVDGLCCLSLFSNDTELFHKVINRDRGSFCGLLEWKLRPGAVLVGYRSNQDLTKMQMIYYAND